MPAPPGKTVLRKCPGPLAKHRGRGSFEYDGPDPERRDGHHCHRGSERQEVVVGADGSDRRGPEGELGPERVEECHLGRPVLESADDDQLDDHPDRQDGQDDERAERHRPGHRPGRLHLVGHRARRVDRSAGPPGGTDRDRDEEELPVHGGLGKCHGVGLRDGRIFFRYPQPSSRNPIPTPRRPRPMPLAVWKPVNASEDPEPESVPDPVPVLEESDPVVVSTPAVVVDVWSVGGWWSASSWGSWWGWWWASSWSWTSPPGRSR